MSSAIVIDASVALAWCFPEEATEATAELQVRLETASAVVPSLWMLEVANALAIAERRSRISAIESDRFLARLQSIGVIVDEDVDGRVFSSILPLARSHRLTAYDAAYLELAI